MEDHETQLNGETISAEKNSTGKKIFGGCGCGCLIIVLVLSGLLYWGYRYFTSYVRGFEEQGYTLVQGQVMNLTEPRTGSYVFFGQKATIGDVNGDVAAMCQQITFEGTVTGNVDLYCQQVTIAESAVIQGNIHAEGVQQLVVHGKVIGEITGAIQQTVNQTQE